MVSDPSVTVLIGAYENERTVARAIASILGQTERDLELIVIDDGSRDGSAAAAEEAIGDDPRGRVMRLERNVGIARSLNAGLEAAAAPVVAIQDADDYSAPERLRAPAGRRSPRSRTWPWSARGCARSTAPAGCCGRGPASPPATSGRC